jgi:hypothetical protein
MFKLNKRGRAKCAKAATGVTGGPVRGYAMGFAHFRWTTSAIVLIAVFGVIFTIGLLAGVILFPGFFLAIAFWQQVRPRRGVAVTDTDLAVMSTSWLTDNDRPRADRSRMVVDTTIRDRSADRG